VALDFTGKVFLVDSQGHSAQLVDLAATLGVGIRAEGVAVAPMTFGPLGGQIVVGVEGNSDDDPQSGKIYAVDKGGKPRLLADIGFTTEHLTFVPENGATYYQAGLSFERDRENRLLSVSASQFLARAGRMLVVNEMSGELWEVAWDGHRYTQSKAGRVPGRWSSEGLALQKTELEGGDFAVLPPALPEWTDWSAVPGDGTTDAKPDAGVDQSGNLHLFTKGIGDRRVYMQSMWRDTEQWTGWMEVPPGGLTTHHSLASVLHETNLHLFAVRDDGRIVHKRVFIGTDPVNAEPWSLVPGGFVTGAAVTAAVGTGRLVVCALGHDKRLYLNELGVGDRGWSGWSPVPGGRHTDTSPTLVTFQDELYLLIKGLTSDRILVRARSLEGFEWTEWAGLPGGVATRSPVAATTFNDKCYVFARGLNDAPYVNVASDSGTWSGCAVLADPGTSDVGPAAAATSRHVYLFAKGTQDQRLYVRRTT
jgi:hypothetical protein